MTDICWLLLPIGASFGAVIYKLCRSTYEWQILAENKFLSTRCTKIQAELTKDDQKLHRAHLREKQWRDAWKNQTTERQLPKELTDCLTLGEEDE